MVVVKPPELKLPPDLCYAEEDIHAQALVAQSSVEGLDIAVVKRASGPNNIRMYAVHMQPMMHVLADELSSAVQGDRFRCTAVRYYPVKDCRDFLSA